MSLDDSSGLPKPVRQITTDVAEGITKGIISSKEKEIKGWVKRLLNKELAFIIDPDKIDLAKDMRNTPEWEIFSIYIQDKPNRILFNMGLTLRRLEKQGNYEAIHDLKRKIREKFGNEGLHIAYLVQNGLFNKYLGNVLPNTYSHNQLSLTIKSLFANIEKTVAYIKNTDDIEVKSQEIITKIHANSPKTFILSGAKPDAMRRCRKIHDNVMKYLPNHSSESYITNDREIFFINHPEDEEII